MLATHLLRRSLDPLIGETTPFVVLFFLPVVVSARFAGLGPALLAAGLALVVGDRVTMDPASGAPIVARIVRAATFLVLGYMVAHLIVSRRRDELALRASEERYRTLAENFPNGAVFLFDHELRFLVAAGRDLPDVGLSGADMVGKTLSEALPEATGDGLASMFRAALDGRTRVAEFEFQGRDYVLHAVPVRGERGDVALGMALAHNITERKRLEHQLRQAQKMDAIGRLAGGVAHDFNNLLTVILGRCEGLLRRLAGREDDVTRDVRAIHDAGSRAASLTKQLLSFSRAQTAELADLDPNEVVWALDPMLRRLIGERIELVTRVDPDVGHVRADRAQIEQALLNLCVNARDAVSERGGTIEITTEAVTVSAASRDTEGVPEGRYARITVRDSGCGMDPSVRDRVFEPFFTTKPTGKGTGLGLSIVHGVVSQHGGHVTITTAPHEGSSFHVFLPTAAARDDQPSRPAPLPGRRGAGELVLLVEDEDAVRTMIADFLRSSGYRVVAASSGEEALAIAAEHRDELRLLVTDVVLTGMSGIELCRTLHEHDPLLRTVFLSGYTRELASIDDFAGSTTTFLAKPFTLHDLLARVSAFGRDVARERGAEPADRAAAGPRP